MQLLNPAQTNVYFRLKTHSNICMRCALVFTLKRSDVEVIENASCTFINGMNRREQCYRLKQNV